MTERMWLDRAWFLLVGISLVAFAWERQWFWLGYTAMLDLWWYLRFIRRPAHG